ncbi:MAG: ribonucleotide-diphosphate reductase subunit beta [Proteobacteria bacterium]|nr:MAG: ribonucleotide-diphosphate reductase subunit beta [Pseudomonadota bacterium]
MKLFDRRHVLRPFQYPELYEMFEKAVQAHWHWNEISMDADADDFKYRLSDVQRHVIVRLLRSFTQIEVDAEDFWAKVAQWFPHAEARMMASTNSATEAVHIAGYDYLNRQLNVSESEYSAFLDDPAIMAKKNNLGKILDDTDTPEGKAIALAVFSAFTEGVSLFASFSILVSFSQAGMMKGLANIIAWSARDESHHSVCGIWLFNQLIHEYPELMTKDFEEKIYAAARTTVEIEDGVIDGIFEMGDIQYVSKEALKNFVRQRTNTKLQDIGFKPIYSSIDQASVVTITGWFDAFLSREHADIFSTESSSYAKGLMNFGGIDWKLLKDRFAAKKHTTGSEG